MDSTHPSKHEAYTAYNLCLGGLNVSEYIHSVKKWCEEVLQYYRDISNQLNLQETGERLQQWEIELLQFKEELSEDGALQDQEAFARGNELNLQLNSFLHEMEENKQMETERVENFTKVVPIGGHTLPPLPYSYDALEPYISEEIMKLHHDKHHKSYVDGLNKAEKEMQQARTSGDFSLIKHWEREAAFNGAGHYLHTIFWNNMHPGGGGRPSGELMRAINQAFGSFDSFKQHFTEAANEVEGGGWAILVWSPRSRRLEILQAEKHQNLSQWDVVPILVLDVWEHAYYLQYKNEKKKYIDNWWNIVNWQDAEMRFKAARKLKWKPY